MIVVDTSALLALIFSEPHADWVAARLDENAGRIEMSTVNLAETLIRLRDRQPTLFTSIERKILDGAIRFVPPTIEHARLAAESRIRFPLNLGDCFAYALAMSSKAPLLTLDADFRKSDVVLIAPA